MLQEPDTVSYIYGIRCLRFIKVGSARNLAKRLLQLSIGNPFKLRIAIFEPVSAHYVIAIERRIHALLKEWHYRGEWYAVDTRTVRRAINQARREIAATLMAADEAYAERSEARLLAQVSRGNGVETRRAEP